MSEKFLNSPGLLLDDLSKKMLYGLDHYPMLAIKHEKIEYFCDRFRQLFNGDYRPVKFQTAMLHSCILQYCECILVFVKDNSVSMKNDEVGYLGRWLSVLDNLGSVDSIKNKFIYFMPVVDYIIFKDVPLWVVKEFLLHLNRLFEKSTQFIFGKKEKKFLFRTVASWLKLIMTCGDYEFQTILVEAIISACELCHIEEILVRNFGKENALTTMFLKVFGKQNYVNDLKTFLTAINGNFHQVRSLPCLKVTLEKTVIPPLNGTDGDETWMHINYGFKTLSFDCQRDSLRSLPASINSFNSNEFVSVNFENVDKVCLLMNNDYKTVNPVGGIFLIYLAGKCSCRFNSSKDIVSSIKKITFIVSDGSHLQYLKETFVQLFGRRFKVANRIPIKKRTFYDKRDSSLNTSTSNSSFRAEKRRSRKKHNDLKSLESTFPTNLKLENKENVLEGTQDCSLNSTGSLFKKPVNLNNTIVTCSSRNWLSTENNLKHSENDRLMFPDTITKAKEKGGRNTTKNNCLSLLKSWDIDTLTTSKHKEMPEENSLVILEDNKSEIIDFINEELNSIPDLHSLLDIKNKSRKAESSGIADSTASLNNKIVTRSSNNWLSTENNLEHSENDAITNKFMNDTKSNLTNKSKGRKGRGTTKNSLSFLKSWDIDALTTSKNKEVSESSKISLVATTEEITIPSNYTLDEENSLVILEENKSEIIDFIPDLENSLDLKYKSGSVKIPKTSNVKLQAKSSNENSRLNVLTEMTFKSKENTGFNPLKRLSKRHKKAKEYKRTEKKESKTVGRLLRSSVKVESAKRNSEIREAPGDVDHSYSRENTDEIGNVEVISKKETCIANAPCFPEFDHLQDNSETPDIDVILAHSTKNINEKNLDIEVIEIIDDETEEMRNTDISIISISSTEETHSLVEHPIENRQYDDIAETTADAQKHLILKINDIEVTSENNKDKTKTYDVQKDISEKQEDTDDRATNSIPSDEATETSDNIISSEHNYSLHADIEEIQTLAINNIITNDHCYASNQAPIHEMASETKYDELTRNYPETSEHKYSLAEKTEMAVKSDDTDIGELQILTIDDIITNNRCDASNRAPMHEMANETKNDEDHFIKSSVDDISVPKKLVLLTHVPILLNDIDYREQASTLKSSKSTEELENSCHSMKSKSIKSGFVGRNKSKIASPFHSKTNRSHNDRQLLKEKYAAAYNDLQESKNEVTRLYAELARKRQKVQELERINKETQTLKPDKICTKKTVTSERKQTEADSSQSEILDNEEMSKSRINDNEIFEKSNEEKTDNFQKSFQVSDGGEFSKKRLSDITATSDAKKRNKVTLESTQTSKPDKTCKEKAVTSERISSQSEISNEKFQKSFQEFIESPRNRLPDNNFLMDNEETDNFQNLLKVSDGGEFSKKRLSDKTATRDAEERISKMHKPKDDSFAKFTLETSPLQFNDRKIPTPTPQMHQSKAVNEDLSFIQGCESITPLDSVKVEQLVKENKNIQLDSGRLYNLIDKPHKQSEKIDKTGNDIYGFDAIIIGLKAYLKTLKTPVERKKKPQKRRIIKIKWGGTKKAKSKSKKRNFGKLF